MAASSFRFFEILIYFEAIVKASSLDKTVYYRYNIMIKYIGEPIWKKLYSSL